MEFTASDDTEALIDLYRQSSDEDTVTRTRVHGGAILGTIGYMAPEQAPGAVSDFSPATDVYGLGGLLCFTLYGSAPNQGESSAATLLNLEPERPVQRGTLRSGILPRGQRIRKEALDAVEALQNICLKALERKPNRRYPNADAMVVELSEWLAVTPPPPIGF